MGNGGVTVGWGMECWGNGGRRGWGNKPGKWLNGGGLWGGSLGAVEYGGGGGGGGGRGDGSVICSVRLVCPIRACSEQYTRATQG